MNHDLRERVLTRLENDYGFKNRGRWLRNGVCTACGKKELYASVEAPWVLRCGRENNCGAEYAVRDLYRDLFDDWSSRYKATEQEPAATAAAYLNFCRGLDPAITAGEYSQENYFSVEDRAGSATVRFALEGGDGEGWWERLIDRPERFRDGKMKARFKPGAQALGRWWRPAALDLATVKELWITEGIFDALALLHHGIQAVAAMSSNMYPQELLETLAKQRPGDLPTLVWALDGDHAGTSYTKMHAQRARALGFTCRAAVIVRRDGGGKRLDWNDLHLRRMKAGDDELVPMLPQVLAECRHQGDLLLAETAREKGQLMYMWRERDGFWFGFRERMYWFEIDDKRHAEAMASLDDNPKKDEMTREQQREFVLQQAGIVREIASVLPNVLYLQRNEVTDEEWYYLRIRFPDDQPDIKAAFTPGQLAVAGDFKKKLLGKGGMWKGKQHHLDGFMEDGMRGVKRVSTIDFFGYSREHAAWIFNNLALHKGRAVPINNEDYFELGRQQVKSLLAPTPSLNFTISETSKGYRDDWFSLIWTCYGEHGVVALAWWLGSLFCEQIRNEHVSYPFLEATGEAGSGKSTLLHFLWKLLGRNYEGFDPNKSTGPGRGRAFAQVAGMPVVLIESDRNTPDKAHVKSFDWDELKDLWDGGSLRMRGVKNGGNDTYEPPFRASICISQNADVNASEAILTRLVKLWFKRREFTDTVRAAADSLKRMEIEQVSHFVVKAATAEAVILEKFEQRMKVHSKSLQGFREINVERVITNHAQIMALVDCLDLLTPITPEQIELTQRQLTMMALERQQVVGNDHALVTQFWEVYEYLEARSPDDRPAVNHSSDPALIAINLNDFAEQAAFHKQSIAELPLLRELLKTSQRYPFVDSNRPTHSTIRAGGMNRSTTVKCWIFKKTT